MKLFWGGGNYLLVEVKDWGHYRDKKKEKLCSFSQGSMHKERGFFRRGLRVLKGISNILFEIFLRFRRVVLYNRIGTMILTFQMVCWVYFWQIHSCVKSWVLYIIIFSHWYTYPVTMHTYQNIFLFFPGKLSQKMTRSNSSSGSSTGSSTANKK